MEQLITGTNDAKIRKKALLNKFVAIQDIIEEGSVNESMMEQGRIIPESSFNYVSHNDRSGQVRP